MPAFDRKQVFILPHAEEYRRLYDVSVEAVVAALNEPDLHEGLADEHYTAEKQLENHRIYVYYYRTLPLQSNSNAYVAIIDFIGVATTDDQPVTHKQREGTTIHAGQE